MLTKLCSWMIGFGVAILHYTCKWELSYIREKMNEALDALEKKDAVE